LPLPLPIVSHALKLDTAAIAATAIMNFLIMLSLRSNQDQGTIRIVRPLFPVRFHY
jgi:hypothetical protein